MLAIFMVCVEPQVPTLFAWEWRKHGTPIAAIVAMSLTTGVLMNLSFQELVVYDVRIVLVVSVAV